MNLDDEVRRHLRDTGEQVALTPGIVDATASQTTRVPSRSTGDGLTGCGGTHAQPQSWPSSSAPCSTGPPQHEGGSKSTCGDSQQQQLHEAGSDAWPSSHGTPASSGCAACNARSRTDRLKEANQRRMRLPYSSP